MWHILGKILLYLLSLACWRTSQDLLSSPSACSRGVLSALCSCVCIYSGLYFSVVHQLYWCTLRGGTGESICRRSEPPIFCIFRSGLEELTTDGASSMLSSIITQNIFRSLVSFLLLISHMFLLGLVLFSPQAISPTLLAKDKNFPLMVLFSCFISQYDLSCSLFHFLPLSQRSTERKWTLESDWLGF